MKLSSLKPPSHAGDSLTLTGFEFVTGSGGTAAITIIMRYAYKCAHAHFKDVSPIICTVKLVSLDDSSEVTLHVYIPPLSCVVLVI